MMQPTQARIVQVSPNDEETANATFPSVPLKIARNFMVTDTIYETPSGVYSAAATAPTDDADFCAPFHGLESVPNDIKDLLPADCRKAFDDAISKDRDWKSRWGPEHEVASRRLPTIDKAIVPYSKG